jgi:threonine aldolase
MYMKNKYTKIIDLRSDTVTKPSREMREAMASAEVGDDVFYEDPTVNRLQEYVAELLGKEKGLYMVSGTMSNQCAIKTHTQPGEEIIAEEGCHIANFESGAPGLLSGVLLRTIIGKNGVFTAEEVVEKIRPASYHYPRTALIEIENTHNRAGGTIFPLEEIKRIRQVADKYNVPMHLDGARLWHASVATGISLAEYAEYFESVSVCFSKGLGAPVGSMLLGAEEFIVRAHKYRKMFGGGMRQAGIIAAGALYAVQNNRGRLLEDHHKAQTLALALADCSIFNIDLETVQTNIVIFAVKSKKIDAGKVMEMLKKENILVIDIGKNKIRAVCHLDVSMDEIELVAKTIRKLFK